MRKKLLLLTATFLLSLSIGTITAQTTEGKQSYVTASMARKITYFCQYNDLATTIFADANEIVSSMELDETIYTLDKHLDCAEKFLLAIYYRYGTVMGYGTLKSMGFTFKEIDTVQAEWKKDDERRAAIAEQRRKEKEREYLKLIEENGAFTPKQLSEQPKINIDLTAISMLLSDNPKNDEVFCLYNCNVNKEGYIALRNPNDTLKFTDIEKRIYNDYIKGYNAFEVGKVKIGDEQIPVNSMVAIKIKESRKQHQHNFNKTLEFNIQKDKRLNFWHILWNEGNYRQRAFRCNDFQGLKSQLTGALNNSPELKRFKGKKSIEVFAYERILECNFSDDVILPHIFEITLNEYGTKTRLNYQTCLLPENAFEEQDQKYLLRCNKIEREYQKHPERFADVSSYENDFSYYISSDGMEYNFASEAYGICLLESEGVYMLFNEQKFVKRK